MEYLSNKAEIFDELEDLNNNTFTPECAQMLKDWIVDISLSEKYYQQKYSKTEKKKAYNVDLDE